MKKLLGVLAALIVSVPLAVFLAPTLIPQSTLERQLAPLLAEATGLQLEEAKALRLSFVPEPGFTFEGVSASLPLGDGDGGGYQIRAGRIIASADPASLLRGRLVLTKVVFEDSSIVIGNDSGRQSAASPRGPHPENANAEKDLASTADLIHSANQEPSKKRRRPLRLPTVDIEIRNGSVSFDGREKNAPLISGTNLFLASLRQEGSATLDGSLRLNGEPVTIKGTAKVPEAGGRSLGLQLTLQSEAGRTELDGVFSPDSEVHFSGKMQVKIGSGEALARMAGSNSPAMIRLSGASLSGPIKLSERQFALSDAVVTAPGAEGRIDIIAGQDGVLQGRLHDFTLHGGKAEGQASYDARQADAVLAATLSISNVDSLALAKGVSGFDWLSGRADLKLEFAGGGHTMEAIAGSLTGKGSLAVSDGAVEGIDLPLIVAEVQDGEFGKWRREAGRRTPFDRLEASFTIQNGIAQTNDLSLKGPNVSVQGEGRTNIARGRINYRLKTKVTPQGRETTDPKEQNEASLAVPLIIKGDWDKPDIRPDIENALKDTDSLKGTAKLFGKSVEKWTDGQVKSDDFGKMIDGLFGKKKKKKKRKDDDENGGEDDGN